MFFVFKLLWIFDITEKLFKICNQVFRGFNKPAFRFLGPNSNSDFIACINVF